MKEIFLLAGEYILSDLESKFEVVPLGCKKDCLGR